jgi:uncharacterized protein
MSASPREVLASYQQAMLAKSADDLADLYAVDAVHDFPFSSPGFPASYQGREEIRAGYRVAWHNHPVDLTDIRDVVTYAADDPAVIIDEIAISGIVIATGQPFELRGLLILEVHGGLITRARDYLDSLSVMRQLPDRAAAVRAN